MLPSNEIGVFMSSPIRVLDQDIINSLVRISPENKDELEQFRIKFEPKATFTSDSGFRFRVNTKTKNIIIPTVALEYLWCSSYTFYLIYIKYTQRQEKGNFDMFHLQSDPELALALEMYKWSSDSLADKKSNWKDNFPSPSNTSSKDKESHESIATELFLCAIAWILHHEIAHIYHEHPNEETHKKGSINQEREADSSATKWILGSITDENLIQKRGLGVIIAILAITSQDILSGKFNNTTHPKSYERLFDAIDPYFKDENHIVYAFSTIILHTHMVISNTDIELNKSNPSWKDDFTDCLLMMSRIKI